MRMLVLTSLLVVVTASCVAAEGVTNPTGPQGPPAQEYAFTSLNQAGSFAGWEFSAVATGDTATGAYTDIQFKLYEHSASMLHLRGFPQGESAATKPYQVPSAVFPALDDVPPSAAGKDSPGSDFVVSVDMSTQKFSIAHKRTGATLLEFSGSKASEFLLSYRDKYLSFNLPLPASGSSGSQPIFVSGFGEHNFDYFLNKNGTTHLSAWNTDNFGLPWGDPLYGVHPIIYVAVPGEPLFYAVAMVNSHTQTLDIPEGGEQRMRYTAVGGLLDLYVITGSTPLEVVQQWYSVINQPVPATSPTSSGAPAPKHGLHVPPYWSLGTHQSRWGYKDIAVLQSVLDGYLNADLPLEALWTDINVMDQYRIFTTDPVLFPTPQLKKFIEEEIHATGRKYVQIVDPGVAYIPDGSYPVYNDGVDKKVFIQWENPFEDNKVTDLINYVWPGQTVFPDFSSAKVQQWWNEQLAQYRQGYNSTAGIAIDGVWLDMNEVASFCPGGCKAKAPATTSPVPATTLSPQDTSASSSAAQTTPAPSFFSASSDSDSSSEMSVHTSGPILAAEATVVRRRSKKDLVLGQGEQPHPDCTICGPVTSSVLNFPQWPDSRSSLGASLLLPQNHTLTTKTLDMTGVTEMGPYYDTKAFYGLLECEATFKSMLNQTGKRPFLLSRSTFAGSGRFTAHWTGDGVATFEPHQGGLPDTIQSVLAANLWGVPMVGADIGGYAFNTTEELVTRWTQVGAFYPFMRNHHWDEGPGQEPYRWSPPAVDAMRRAMQWRYKLLPYMFTCLTLSAFEDLPVLRHLSLEFPFDLAAYRESYNYMFGPSLLVLPLVLEGEDSVKNQYIPNGAPWFTLWSGEAASQGGGYYSSPTTGQSHSSHPDHYSDVPVLLKAGSIIPLHTSPKLTVEQTRMSGHSLLVAMNPKTRSANGRLLLDDGTDSPVSQHHLSDSFTQASFQATGGVNHGLLSSSVSKRAIASKSTQPVLVNGTITVYLWHSMVSEDSFYMASDFSGQPISGTGQRESLLVQGNVFTVSINGSTIPTQQYTVSNASVPNAADSQVSEVQTLVLTIWQHAASGLDLSFPFTVAWGFAAPQTAGPTTTTTTTAPVTGVPTNAPILPHTTVPSAAPTPTTAPSNGNKSTDKPTSASAPAPAPPSDAGGFHAMLVLVVILSLVLCGLLVWSVLSKLRKSRQNESNGGWESYGSNLN